MKFDDAKKAIEYFIELQLSILNKKQEYEELLNKNEALKKASEDYQGLMQKYRTGTQEYFGFTDNQSFNVVQLADFVMRLQK